MSGKETWPKVAIIVLNWNGWRDTIECLESLQRLTYPNYQIIVVDNGSTDDSVEKIKAWARGEIPVESKFVDYDPKTKPVHWVEYDQATEAGKINEEDASLKWLPSNQKMIIIQTGENLGFAAGNNVGIQFNLHSDKEIGYILVLNNDTVVTHSLLTEFVKAAKKPSENIDMVAPVVLNYHNPNLVDRLGIVLTRSGLAYDRKYLMDGPLFCPSGCCALYSREMLEAVKMGDSYFDSSFFVYGEDVDLGFRARLLGYQATLTRSALVYHKGSASTGGVGSSPSIYYRHRNTILYLIKNLPNKIFWRYLGWIVLGQLGGVIRNIGRANFRWTVSGKCAALSKLSEMYQKRRTIQRQRVISVRELLQFIDSRPLLIGRHRKTFPSSGLVEDKGNGKIQQQ
ncbi:MAG: Glycosyl transferase, family 2 [Synergistales bacterium 53_16]|nr:MAG: Glycosyl transferase, family 2 [Synergistales bacterium 53_16]